MRYRKVPCIHRKGSVRRKPWGISNRSAGCAPSCILRSSPLLILPCHFTENRISRSSQNWLGSPLRSVASYSTVSRPLPPRCPACGNFLLSREHSPASRGTHRQRRELGKSRSSTGSDQTSAPLCKYFPTFRKIEVRDPKSRIRTFPLSASWSGKFDARPVLSEVDLLFLLWCVRFPELQDIGAELYLAACKAGAQPNSSNQDYRCSFSEEHIAPFRPTI